MRITWLDRQAVRRELDQAVRELARQHPEIERVILFGSFATGCAVPGSDVDLLILLTSSDQPFVDRIPLYAPARCRVGADVFPYTRGEFERMRASGNQLLRRALAQGIEIPLGR